MQAVHTAVKNIVESQLKSYSDAVQENVILIVYQPEHSVIPKTFQEIVKSELQEEDLSRKIMVFGLPEETIEEINRRSDSNQ